MLEPKFKSASGVRPVAAFFSIVCVLLAVAAKSAIIAVQAKGEQPIALRSDVDLRPSFRMLDQSGRPLGMSVECFDLTMSPQAMWGSHTPTHMAQQIADVLGDISAAELLPRMLDADAVPSVPGCYRIAQPELLLFDELQAGKVMRWIRSGVSTGERTGGLDGLHLVRHSVHGKYTIEWEPAVLLSREQRLKHAAHFADRPSRWTRLLLDDLGRFIDPARVEAVVMAEEGVKPTRAQLSMQLRDRIWKELMPCQFRVVVHRIDPVTARALDRLLKEEAVSSWQMKLEACMDRRHPTRPNGQAVGPVPEPLAYDAFPILGAWGVLGPQDAWARALDDHGLESGRPILDARVRTSVAESALQYETEYRPWSGLELACYIELRHPRWSEVFDLRPRNYLRSQRIVPRDRHKTWRAVSEFGRIEVPDYFRYAETASEPPDVITTLDADLQTYLHLRLQETRQENAAALAMGIVVDIDTGDVLAIDSSCAYPYSGFAPIRHVFTPGSTFKVPVMASALDAGVVHPDENFATYPGQGLLVIDPKRGSSRRIREAEGAPREPQISATIGLARSVNAVLVQIGLRVPAAELRKRLSALGYGRSVNVELGPESAGYLPALKKGTWSRVHTHASVSFGHEVSTTLWQHATALATIARGGAHVPLRMIRGVEQEGRRFELQPEKGEQVLSFEACMNVRAMLREGALAGTGEPVAGIEVCPEFEYIGTKTGTTEKVVTELCVHEEFKHQAEHLEQRELDPKAPTCHRTCLSSLRGKRAHKRQSCYTSSMLSIGRPYGSEREVLVLIVVDGPRNKARFGREVAGQCNIDVLRKAFDLPSTTELLAEEAGTEPVLANNTLSFNESDLPWIESTSSEEALHGSH
ncbi:MAG: hypothetical protein ACI835_000072 [Planctomycetota bacterium]|jgi:hypothetical protein